MSCKILTPEQFEVSRAERLVWTCSVHLVAKANDLRAIGEVVEQPFWKQTEDCMRELAAAVHSTTVHPAHTSPFWCHPGAGWPSVAFRN